MAPGAMLPVSKLLPVAVCVTLSAFIQAIVWPAFTEAGFGEKELPPFMPLIMTTRLAATGVGVMFGCVGLIP